MLAIRLRHLADLSLALPLLLLLGNLAAESDALPAPVGAASSGGEEPVRGPAESPAEAPSSADVAPGAEGATAAEASPGKDGAPGAEASPGKDGAPGAEASLGAEAPPGGLEAPAAEAAGSVVPAAGAAGEPAEGSLEEDARPQRPPLPEGPPTPEETELLTRLRALWELRRTEITTADLRFLDYPANAPQEARLTRREAVALVAEFDLVARPEDVRHLIARTRGRPEADRPLREASRLRLQPGQRRWTYWAFDKPFEMLVDGDLEFHYDALNRQMDVYPLGKSMRMMPQDQMLRFVPGAGGFSQSELRVVERGEGSARLIGTGVDGLVDEATGLFHWIRFGAWDDSGRMHLHQERFEQGFVEYPGGVVFPTATIEFRYRDGRLQQTWARVLREAQFNLDLPADAFKLPGDEQLRIVDHRGPQKVTPRLKAATPDLRAALPRPEIPAATRGPADPGRTLRLRALLGLNAVVLACLGFWLWRLSRRQPQRVFRLGAGARARDGVSPLESSPRSEPP